MAKMLCLLALLNLLKSKVFFPALSRSKIWVCSGCSVASLARVVTEQACASAVLSQWGPGWGYRAHFGRDAAVMARSLLPGAELCRGNSQQHAKSREETHRKALQEQLRRCLTTQEVPAHPEGNNCLPSCSSKTLTAKTAEKKPVCPGLGYLQLTASCLLPFRALPASLKYCEGTWLNSTTTLPYGQAQFT